MPVRDVASVADLDAALAKAPVAALNFWAAWSEPGKAMDAVFEALAGDYPGAAFLRVEAEADALAAATEQYGITVVPTFVFVKDGAVVGRVEGADAPALADAAAAHLKAAGAPAAAAAPPPPMAPAPAAPVLDATAKARLQALVKSAPVILFMKGSPDAPRCGFSRRVVTALQTAAIPFASHDILTDPEAREGLKVMMDWPTFPMLVAGGELVGGCDIVEELAASGELAAEVAAAAKG